MTHDHKAKISPELFANSIRTQRDKIANQVRSWASNLFPNYIDSPSMKCSRAYHEGRDDEEIPKSIPPEKENIALKTVIAAEFYTPAHAEELFHAFERVGWNSTETSPFQRNSTEWVSRSRLQGRGGWINLGTILAQSSNSRLDRTTHLAMPTGFEEVQVELFSVTSSLSCIVFTFIATQETESFFEKTVRQRLGTQLRKNKRGHSIHYPMFLKKELIWSIRDNFRENIHQWIARNFPGAFSTSTHREFFPTCEVLFSRNIHPPSNTKRETTNLWSGYLGLQHLHSWLNRGSFPGLRMFHPVSNHDGQQGHAILLIDRADLQEMEMSLYGGHNDDAYLTSIFLELPSLICHWSISMLLNLYRQELNAVRDSRLASNHAADPTDILRRLRQIASNSVDISLLASELPVGLTSGIWSSSSFYSEGQANDQNVTLYQTLNERALWSVAELEESDKIIRNYLMQQGNLVSSLESVSTQRNITNLTKIMTWLTVAILVLTASMAYLTFFPITDV